jgi:CBS domain-containing protein
VRRRHLTVAEVMTQGEAMPILSLDNGRLGALHRLADGDVDHVPVVQDGRVVGLLGRREVVRWLEGQFARPL